MSLLNMRPMLFVEYEGLVSRFLKESCQRAPGVWTPTHVIRDHFANWVKSRAPDSPALDRFGPDLFSKALLNAGHGRILAQRKRLPGGRRAMFFKGIEPGWWDELVDGGY